MGKADSGDMEKDYNDYDGKWENYEACMKQFVLPASMADGWEVQECLKDGKDSWTVLVRERASGIILVLKWGQGLCKKLLIQEEAALKELNARKLRGIPMAYRLFEEGDSVYFLREYIPGRSLQELADYGTSLREAVGWTESGPFQDYGSLKGNSCFAGGFTEPEIRRIGVEICRLVSELHNLPVPMIHRDIKPGNVVVDPEGKVFLVDFGTARLMKTGRDSDTLCLGSRGTAAPEQYGSMQTDRRTDVYAIGRTLLYLAVQSYDEKQLADSGLSRGFQKVLRKACAFEPDRRYRDMEELGKALAACGERKKLRAACACAAVFLAVAGGIGWMYRTGAADHSVAEPTELVSEETGLTAEKIESIPEVTEAISNKTDTMSEEPDEPESMTEVTEATSDEPELMTEETEATSDEPESMTEETEATPDETEPVTDEAEPTSVTAELAAESVVFQEPMIEEAVRKQLGLDADAVITPELLDEIRSIRIFGTEILEQEDELDSAGSSVLGKDSSYGQERGEISDLSDLKKMKNLEEVVLYNQLIEDLTPLKGLNIRTLYLGDNIIEDFSVLTTLPNLEILGIAYNPAEDLSCLGECENLKELNLNGLRLTNLEFIRNLSLIKLYMADCLTEEDTDYEFLLTQTNLTELCLSEFDEEKAQVVSQMKWLYILELWGGSEMEDLTSLQNLDKMYTLQMSEGFRSLDGVGELNSLSSLILSGCTDLTDLSELSEAKFVSYLDIRDCGITDYSVLSEIPKLETVFCTQEQQEAILALDASPGFEVLCG